jgi:hypothetical protein
MFEDWEIRGYSWQKSHIVFANTMGRMAGRPLWHECWVAIFLLLVNLWFQFLEDFRIIIREAYRFWSLKENKCRIAVSASSSHLRNLRKVASFTWKSCGGFGFVSGYWIFFQFSWEPKSWGEISVAQISHLWWFLCSKSLYKFSLTIVFWEAF